MGAIDAAALGMDEKRKSFLYFDRDFSGWYNFRKIIETVVIRCHILKLKCTKVDFVPLGELTALLAGFKGPTSKGKEGKGGEGKGGA